MRQRSAFRNSLEATLSRVLIVALQYSPEPVADYVRSMSGTTHHANPALVVEKVVSTFPRASDGHFVITSHSGCLICEAD